MLVIEHDIRPWNVRYTPLAQDFSKLYCVYAGRGSHEVGGEEHPVATGDVVFVPPGRLHVDNPVGRRTYSKFYCHFRARSAGLDLSAFLELPAVVRCGRRAAEMRALFASLFAEQHGTGCVDGLRATARLRDIIALVIQLVPDAQARFRWSPPLTRLDQVIAALSADLRREHRLKDLAQLVGVHPNHLCRLFTRSVGVPPHQYLTQLRLRRAQELLRTTDLAIDAIADATGFANVQHFTRAFSARFSTPPAHFRAATLRQA